MSLNLLKRTAPSELVAYAESELKQILSDVPYVDALMLCSTDGFELAFVHKRNSYNTSKLAAVSSSILAMVQAFLSEINLHGCQSITLDAVNGKAVLTTAPHHQYPLIIVTLAGNDVLLGQLLYTIKKASANIIAFQKN
jgi:predicted regulator of Ras-like GTPase activity (Roadblock/LC7/MglB family)